MSLAEERFQTEEKLVTGTGNHSVPPESAREEEKSPTERAVLPLEKKDIEDAHSEEVAIQKEEVVYKGECHRWLIITVIVLG